MVGCQKTSEAPPGAQPIIPSYSSTDICFGNSQRQLPGLNGPKMSRSLAILRFRDGNNVSEIRSRQSDQEMVTHYSAPQLDLFEVFKTRLQWHSRELVDWKKYALLSQLFVPPWIAPQATRSSPSWSSEVSWPNHFHLLQINSRSIHSARHRFLLWLPFPFASLTIILPSARSFFMPQVQAAKVTPFAVLLKN